VRFAYAEDEEQAFKVFNREAENGSWKLLFDEAKTHVRYVPQRFNPDDKIKANVMLITGDADDRVPDDHAKAIRSELRSADVDPEWLYDRSEGHGFYSEEHLKKLFEKLIAFVGRNIGASSANPIGAGETMMRIHGLAGTASCQSAGEEAK
jgi:dienelactone hydrolase